MTLILGHLPHEHPRTDYAWYPLRLRQVSHVQSGHHLHDDFNHAFSIHRRIRFVIACSERVLVMSRIRRDDSVAVSLMLFVKWVSHRLTLVAVRSLIIPQSV